MVKSACSATPASGAETCAKNRSDIPIRHHDRLGRHPGVVGSGGVEIEFEHLGRRITIQRRESFPQRPTEVPDAKGMAPTGKGDHAGDIRPRIEVQQGHGFSPQGLAEELKERFGIRRARNGEGANKEILEPRLAFDHFALHPLEERPRARGRGNDLNQSGDCGLPADAWKAARVAYPDPISVAIEQVGIKQKCFRVTFGGINWN